MDYCRDGTDSLNMLPKDSRIKYYYDNDKRKELYDEMCLSLDTNDKLKAVRKKRMYYLNIIKGFSIIAYQWVINLCANAIKNEFLLHMDDDDYYPAQSVQLKASIKSLETDNHCLFCTTVPNFDINQYKSIKQC